MICPLPASSVGITFLLWYGMPKKIRVVYSKAMHSYPRSLPLAVNHLWLEWGKEGITLPLPKNISQSLDTQLGIQELRFHHGSPAT